MLMRREPFFDIELPLLGSEIDKGAHQILLITAGQVHSPQGLAWRRKVGQHFFELTASKVLIC